MKLRLCLLWLKIVIASNSANVKLIAEFVIAVGAHLLTNAEIERRDEVVCLLVVVTLLMLAC